MENFINDDDGYIGWIRNNPNGYVVNSYRKPKREYLILHRADCGQISTPKRSNWTTRNYVKFCSLDRYELENWAETELNGKLWSCRKCKP